MPSFIRQLWQKNDRSHCGMSLLSQRRVRGNFTAAAEVSRAAPTSRPRRTCRPSRLQVIASPSGQVATYLYNAGLVFTNPPPPPPLPPPPPPPPPPHTHTHLTFPCLLRLSLRVYFGLESLAAVESKQYPPVLMILDKCCSFYIRRRRKNKNKN